ncbi:MAG: hypothetical protein A3K68_04525 [Euryarchaeota archaeon RBG_16_68_13]|nr:MAG: hypothetical protein A3K68_04525 [Euryarchaeota archaeon RBG_16_68_13]
MSTIQWPPGIERGGDETRPPNLTVVEGSKGGPFTTWSSVPWFVSNTSHRSGSSPRIVAMAAGSSSAESPRMPKSTGHGDRGAITTRPFSGS